MYTRHLASIDPHSQSLDKNRSIVSTVTDCSEFCVGHRLGIRLSVRKTISVIGKFFLYLLNLLSNTGPSLRNTIAVRYSPTTKHNELSDYTYVLKTLSRPWKNLTMCVVKLSRLRMMHAKHNVYCVKTCEGRKDSRRFAKMVCVTERGNG